MLKNIWRFYDSANSISGIVVAQTPEEAKSCAEYYLSIQFDDIAKNKNFDVAVWSADTDDDYREDYPYALAVSYV